MATWNEYSTASSDYRYRIATESERTGASRVKVVHVLPNVSGTTIPVEIASAIDDVPGIDSRIVSQQPLPDSLPDTIHSEQILQDRCGRASYREALRGIAVEFDITHTHHIEPAAKVGLLSAFKRIPHVNTQHGHLHYTFEEKLKNIPGALTAGTLVYNSSCTANSYSGVERLLGFRTDEHVVHNGVDTDLVGSHVASIDEISTVVTATRLVPRKNLGTLIRAIVHFDDIRLRIIGDGPERSTLERIASEHGVEGNVEFLGYLLNREDVYRELAKGDVFALPSHGEGFCVAAAEAMAIGLPVVVSDLPIFHEVVGSDGVFVDRIDPRDVANAIEELRDDPARARELGQRNRERVFNEFSLAQCAEGYADVYRSMLDA